MRLIYEVIDDLSGLPDANVSPIAATLEMLLGGERGTLPDLADRFTQAGLGHIMASWIGDGPRLPVTAQDLRRVLGNERVGDFATLAGLSSDDFLLHFARLLPLAVNRMTSEGEQKPRTNSVGRPSALIWINARKAAGCYRAAHPRRRWWQRARQPMRK